MNRPKMQFPMFRLFKFPLRCLILSTSSALFLIGCSSPESAQEDRVSLDSISEDVKRSGSEIDSEQIHSVSLPRVTDEKESAALVRADIPLSAQPRVPTTRPSQAGEILPEPLEGGNPNASYGGAVEESGSNENADSGFRHEEGLTRKQHAPQSGDSERTGSPPRGLRQKTSIQSPPKQRPPAFVQPVDSETAPDLLSIEEPQSPDSVSNGNVAHDSTAHSGSMKNQFPPDPSTEDQNTLPPTIAFEPQLQHPVRIWSHFSTYETGILFSDLIIDVDEQSPLPSGLIFTQTIPEGWNVDFCDPPIDKFDPQTRTAKWLLLPGEIHDSAILTLNLAPQNGNSNQWAGAPAWYSFRAENETFADLEVLPHPESEY